MDVKHEKKQKNVELISRWKYDEEEKKIDATSIPVSD